MRGKGMVVDLTALPDVILDEAERLHNQFVEEQNAAAERAKNGR